MPDTFAEDLFCPPAHDGHLLLLHTSEAQRGDGVAAWVRQGLNRGEKIIYTDAHVEQGSGAMLATLRDHGVDGEAATRAGLLERLPLEVFYRPGGWMDAAQRALGGGHRRVRVAGDARMALRRMPRERHLALEAAATDLCRGAPISILCLYDPVAASVDHLDAIVTTHLDGVHERQMGTAPHPGGLAFFGEIDLRNEDLFRRTLRAALGRVTAELVVELSGVTFLGVGGARALVTTTQTFRDGGGTLRLEAPSAPVERLLRMLRVERLPGMELESASGTTLAGVW
ncbi:MAG: STAS domain-containing protein [Actinomycetales bacterium]|nr:STAS domain-containing protein [Actinomycetales bacterium]